jgi:hypothetical protein
MQSLSVVNGGERVAQRLAQAGSVAFRRNGDRGGADDARRRRLPI